LAPSLFSACGHMTPRARCSIFWSAIAAASNSNRALI
jgi:hypothetical protein